MGTALEVEIIARVLEFSELTQDNPLIDDLTSGKVHDQLEKRLVIAQSIDRGHR